LLICFLRGINVAVLLSTFRSSAPTLHVYKINQNQEARWIERNVKHDKHTSTVRGRSTSNSLILLQQMR
jgi:hypothetical protein